MSSPNPVNPQTGGAPAAKKSNPLLWILVGCGGLIIIVVLIMLAGGLFVFHKAQQAGFDPELMKENPALAVTKMIAATNPDVEVMGVDEDSGKITLRDKKSGKTVTVDFDELKNGKITFQDDKGQTATIDTEGEGDQASVRMTSPEGSMKLGAAASSDLPDWLPAYPGATVEGIMKQEQSGGASTAAFTFETGDSVEQVIQSYSKRLKQAGFQVSTVSEGASGGGMITAEDSANKRQIMLMLGVEKGRTMGSLTCSEGE